MKKALLGLVALAILIYLGIAVLGGSIGSTSLPKCDTVDIEIKTPQGRELFMDEADIRSELARMHIKLEGQPLDSINVHAVEVKLRENPIFHNAEVYMTRGTRKVKIKLEQHDPFFLVQSGDSTYYVSIDRGIIPVNPRYAVYVPVVTGAIDRSYAIGDLYDLMRTISQDPYFEHYFGHYYYDPMEGLVLTPRVGHTRILLGKETNWSEMLHRLKVFDQEVIPVKGWDRFEYLRLNYSGQVIAQERSRHTSPLE